MGHMGMMMEGVLVYGYPMAASFRAVLARVDMLVLQASWANLLSGSLLYR